MSGAPCVACAEVDPEDKSIAEALVLQTSTLRRGAGLLVIGAAGKGATRRGGVTLSMGRVAEHVLLHCKCPLLLVKGGDMAITAEPPLRPRQPPPPRTLAGGR